MFPVRKLDYVFKATADKIIRFNLALPCGGALTPRWMLTLLPYLIRDYPTPHDCTTGHLRA